MISITISFPTLEAARDALQRLVEPPVHQITLNLEPGWSRSEGEQQVAPAGTPPATATSVPAPEAAPPKRPRGRPRKNPAPAAAPEKPRFEAMGPPATAPVQTPAPAPIAPQAQPQAAPQPAAAPEPVLTREAVLALIRQAMSTVGVGTVRQQFASLGATSISDLPEEKWPTLVANLRNAQKVLG